MTRDGRERDIELELGIELGEVGDEMGEVGGVGDGIAGQ